VTGRTRESDSRASLGGGAGPRKKKKKKVPVIFGAGIDRLETIIFFMYATRG